MTTCYRGKFHLGTPSQSSQGRLKKFGSYTQSNIDYIFDDDEEEEDTTEEKDDDNDYNRINDDDDDFKDDSSDEDFDDSPSKEKSSLARRLSWLNRERQRRERTLDVSSVSPQPHSSHQEPHASHDQPHSSHQRSHTLGSLPSSSERRHYPHKSSGDNRFSGDSEGSPYVAPRCHQQQHSLKLPVGNCYKLGLGLKSPPEMSYKPRSSFRKPFFNRDSSDDNKHRSTSPVVVAHEKSSMSSSRFLPSPKGFTSDTSATKGYSSDEDYDDAVIRHEKVTKRKTIRFSPSEQILTYHDLEDEIEGRSPHHHRSKTEPSVRSPQRKLFKSSSKSMGGLLAGPGHFLVGKYNQYKKQQREAAKRRAADRELYHLNYKIVSCN